MLCDKADIMWQTMNVMWQTINGMWQNKYYVTDNECYVAKQILCDMDQKYTLLIGSETMPNP